MTDAADLDEAAAAPPRRRWRWPIWLIAVPVMLLAALAAALWLIDTGPGHRLLTDRIGRIETKTGLRFHIGRIDGSIYHRARLRDVRISDPKGVIFDAPEIALDWRPLAWLSNRLEIHSLTAETATLRKAPELRPGGGGPILPGFDIRVGRLAIDRLRLAPALTGVKEMRVATLQGSADVRSGRAMVKLNATAGTTDRVFLTLDAEPDGDRFDLSADVRSAAGGVIGGMIGTAKPLELRIAGDGRWRGWKGTGRLIVADRQALLLDLGAKDGEYTLAGTADLEGVVAGKVARLAAPQLAISGTFRLADRRLDTDLSLRSAALTFSAVGVADLARSRFDAMKLSADLLQPRALFPNMSGRDVRARVLLDGPFDSAAFQYVLASPHVAFDTTGFDLIQVSGQGRLSKLPIVVPIRVKAARVTGVGDVAGGILANLSVEGALRVSDKAAIGDGLKLRSDKLNGTISLFLDLVSGRYEVGLQGQLNRYLIPGLGIVDVKSSLTVVPGPNGVGTRVVGRGQAWVRRFDNAFLAGLAGGLPRIDTRLERTPDGIIRFTGLRIVAPALTISGNGYRRLDGSFHFEGNGTQVSYGPVKLVLDGQIDRPKLSLVLARPMPALGLKDVHVALDPNAEGFAYQASGGSVLGPFTAAGAILMPPNGPTRITVAPLTVSGTTATGTLVSMPGGFDGQLAFTGGGVSGSLRFDRAGAVQRITAALTARDARFAGPPQTTIRRLSINGAVLLDPAGLGVDARVTARGVRRGGLTVGRLSADVDMKGGTGTVVVSAAGRRGKAFALQGTAQVAPERIAITGGGTIERQRLKLDSAAVLTREGGAWRLAPTALSFNGGTARVSGRFGEGANAVDATLERMPLSILDLVSPGMGLGGAASGRVVYTAPTEGAPSGQVDLVVRGLSRSGLVLSSQPIDVAVKGALTGSSAAARAVAASGGKIIGRAQARLAPLGEGAFVDRIYAAPLFAQIRYDGPADTLWRLTGTELFDISGPATIAADINGTLTNPLIRGSIRTENARLQSAVSGTVLTNLKASGRFSGSRLLLDSLTANAGDGTVSGSGVFDLSDRGLAIDLRVDTQNATLLNRDDLGATVTGPLTFKSNGDGGVIGGEVSLNRSRYRLGRAEAATAVPRLKVTEINRPDDEPEAAAPAAPWRLALKADARNRMMVTGLGLDSEWRATLEISGAIDAPIIVGRADLLRGNYEFAGRSFDLDRGVIRFTGSNPPDPVLDISATATLQGLNATIRVTGTGLKPEIAFTSNPALPEDELLSRLLFGTSITNLSAPEALQLAAAVAGLQSDGGLDPINAVRRAAGLDRLRIIAADPTQNQSTSIAAGKYVTRRIYVEVITDGQGYSATRAEFQITRWLSLLSSISTMGRTSANIRVSKDY